MTDFKKHIIVIVDDFTFGINGSLRKREEHSPNPCTEYYLFNSQANLKAYSYNGLDFAYYGYNAANTRTYKLSMLNMGQWVNGQPHPIHLQIQQAMFYPNAYINFNQNGEYTKHYYNGSERIASRLGDAGVVIAATVDDRMEERRMCLDALFRSQISGMMAEEEPLTPAIPMRSSGSGTRELVFPPVEYNPIPALTDLQPTGNTSDIFYYHTNHLGSTAYVTDQSQNVTQGFLYAPFGEITTEYNANFGSDIIPKYSFNAKELDEETGMYYYEARYYKPPVFISRDPLFEKYPTFSPYAYCANNSVKYIDPDGRSYSLFDENGEYMETIKDNWWHNTFVGRKGRVVDNEGNVLQTFRFADPKNDVNDLKNGTINKLYFVQNSDIIKMLSRAGAFDKNNKVANTDSRYDYIKKEGVGGGKFDFSYTGIPKQYPEASIDPMNQPSSMLFLIDGVAHNHMNFGNFLFGAAGEALGITSLELRLGAQWNSLMNPSSNGYRRQFDSSDDQFSIRKGAEYAKRHGYHKMYYKVTADPLLPKVLGY